MLKSDVDTRQKTRYLTLIAVTVLLVVALLVSVAKGAVNLSLAEIYGALMGVEENDTQRIVRILRLPRSLITALVGANLALAGCILQGVLRNPLADPGIIGVSAGAGMFAMILMILAPEHTNFVPLAAFVGALFASGLVFLLAWERGINPLRMILAGVAIAAFFGGGMSAVMVFYSDRIQGTVAWMAGGFQGRSWMHVRMILPYSAVGIVGTLFWSRQLNALQLGDEVARSLGIRVERTRTILIIMSSLLAASAVSVAGLLGFVGLVVPHIMRMAVGSDYEYLMPCSAIAGAFLVTAADTFARVAFAPLEIPVGIFMAFLGAPFFLYLLRRRIRT